MAYAILVAFAIPIAFAIPMTFPIPVPLIISIAFAIPMAFGRWQIPLDFFQERSKIPYPSEFWLAFRYNLAWDCLVYPIRNLNRQAV